MLTTLEKILFLRQLELFSEFSARELGMIAQKTTVEDYSRDEFVFHQGDQGDALYIVLGGKVKVVDEESEEKKLLAVMEEKSFFGEMAILSDQTRTAGIQAAETTTLLKIRKEDFHNLVVQKPEVAFHVFNVLIRRLKKANTR